MAGVLESRSLFLPNDLVLVSFSHQAKKEIKEIDHKGRNTGSAVYRMGQ